MYSWSERTMFGLNIPVLHVDYQFFTEVMACLVYNIHIQYVVLAEAGDDNIPEHVDPRNTKADHQLYNKNNNIIQPCI